MVLAPRRVVYITLEYLLADLFSGNGIAARSHVRRLSAQKVSVLVLCGTPVASSHNSLSTPSRLPSATEPEIPGIKVITVPLHKWFTTDRFSSYDVFATEAAAILKAHDVFETYDAVMAVDWTAMTVIQEFEKLGGAITKPIMYMNFRVYSSMNMISKDDRRFYRRQESYAVRRAIRSGGAVMALCQADEQTLRAMEEDDDLGGNFGWNSRFRVVPPMLRQEFLNLAREDEDQILDFNRKRMYLVSVVRLSEDKGPHRFLKLLQTLQDEDPEIWTKTGVVPLICGADSQPEYAKRIKEELRRTVPNTIIMDKFLGPHELAAVLKNSVLNIHPAVYEAYGMTIVEAAAMGCPTVMHETGIGAAQLLNPRNNASAVVDVTNEREFAMVVRRLLRDQATRMQLAHAAYLHSTSWTETEHVRAILDFTNERIEATQGKTSP